MRMHTYCGHTALTLGRALLTPGGLQAQDLTDRVLDQTKCQVEHRIERSAAEADEPFS